ncbi:MAG: hypothetical protein LBB74_10525 [Chitinispirillales bacterium]|jgi:uncharacterized protein (TIGR02145 family)|nr:hypothetical protein [Chitinispirillales bacterium]
MGLFNLYGRTILLMAAQCFAAAWLSLSAAQGAGEVRTFTDTRDGKIYKTVRIGGRTWMAENLNYKTGNSWCYGNDTSNCGKYGRLYDWKTARDACPSGWHLPVRQEWDKLVTTAHGTKSAGNILKARSGWDWNEKEDITGNGIDFYGFSALPGGVRDIDGSFKSLGTDATYWANTKCECDSGYNSAYGRYMDAGFNNAKNAVNEESAGLSVRCVMTGSSAFRDTRDDKTYLKTTIGNQTWMAENLNYKTDSSWCYMGNPCYCDIYGRLYDWNTANGACPPGWHLPSYDEWDTLARVAGGGENLKSESGWDTRFSVTWKDEYEFSALPTGRLRNSRGEYNPVYGDGWGEWWTTAVSGKDSAFVRTVNYYNDDRIGEYKVSKNNGVPVRCVEDRK